MHAHSVTGARWRLRGVSEPHTAELSRSLGLSLAAARCLALRLPDEGPPDPRWLSPSLDALHDPHLMLGMDAALDRLRRAMRDKERIRVVTDYDVDGTTSSLILQAVLRMCAPDLQLDYHIPNRFHEGYGFSVLAAERAADDGIGLIVTADIGVRDHASVDAARARGVDVLICDHHLPDGASVPENALVLCPPQAGDAYPNRSLAACGVSLKLAQALLVDHPRKQAMLRSLMKLAAIGTVADMVSLNTTENRAIVTLGLQALNQDKHSPGLTALLAVAGLEPGKIDEGALGFRVGPRINAAGRLADASLVVRLLGCRDQLTARDLAKELDKLNQNRKDVQRRVAEQALEAVGPNPPAFVVVHGPEAEGWHRGVVGIVAAKLKDQLHRPVAVVSVQGDHAVGSVRSVPAVHAVEALASASDLLVRFGGHPAAAGFTVPTSQLGALAERLAAFATQAGAEALVPEKPVDAELTADQLDMQLFHELQRFSPFGMGNPRPALQLSGVRLMYMEAKAGEHKLLKARLQTPSGPVDCIWWGQSDLIPQLEGQTLDLLGNLELHTWRDTTRLQFVIEDARLSS